MLKRLRFLCSVITILVMAGDSNAQDFCGDILRFGIYETFESVDTRYLVTESQHLYCKSAAGSNQNNTAFGFNIQTVIETLPAEFGGYYRNKDESAWREQVCQYDWNKLADWSTHRLAVVTASQTIANAWSRCMEAQQNGVVAGIKFSTPTDFTITVQIRGLPDITNLTYNRPYSHSGIGFVPATAAVLVDDFASTVSFKSREHSFRATRRSAGPFDILIASKPNPVKLSVPSSEPPADKPLPPFAVKNLADLPAAVIEGAYSPRSCYGSSVIITADQKGYPDSVVMPPGNTGRSAVEWDIPFGAKLFHIDGAAFCHEPGKRDCFDSNNGNPYSRYRVYLDGQLVLSGDLGGRHDLPPSVNTNAGKGFTVDVQRRRRLRLETDDGGNGRWCDHTTFLNPRFE